MNASPHISQPRSPQDRYLPQGTNGQSRQGAGIDLLDTEPLPLERAANVPLVCPVPRDAARATGLRAQLPGNTIEQRPADFTWFAKRPEVTQVLTSPDSDVNKQWDGGTTVLMLAVVQSELYVLQTMLAHPGTNVNLRDLQGNTPLHLAAQAGRVEQLDVLLDDGRIDAGVMNVDGNTALCLAAKNDHDDVVKHLLIRRPQNGNTSGLSTHENFKAYRLALDHNAFRTITLLLDTLPGLQDATGSDGHTALTSAIKAGRLDVVQTLLKKYPDHNVNLAGEMLGTALNVAVRQRDVGMVLTLLRHPGLDPNWPVDSIDSTALHLAAASGDANIVQALMSALPVLDVDAMSQSLDTPLHRAAYCGDAATLRVLAMRVDDLNQRDRDGKSALHFAAGSGNIEAVQFLLQLADIDRLATSNVGEYPSDIATQCGHTDIARVLHDAEFQRFVSSNQF